MDSGVEGPLDEAGVHVFPHGVEDFTVGTCHGKWVSGGHAANHALGEKAVDGQKSAQLEVKGEFALVFDGGDEVNFVWLGVFGDFHGDHATKADPANAVGLAGVDVGGHAASIIGEAFLVLWGNEFNDLVVQALFSDFGKEAGVCAHAGNEVELGPVHGSSGAWMERKKAAISLLGSIWEKF